MRKTNTKNPFFLNFRIKNIRQKPGQQLRHQVRVGSDLTDVETGEMLSILNVNETKIVTLEPIKIDAENKVSITEDALIELEVLGLPAPLCRLLAAASKSRTDHCKPDFTGISDRTVRHWVKILTDSGWISPKEPGRFWLNPSKIFGFNRIKKLSEFQATDDGSAAGAAIFKAALLS